MIWLLLVVCTVFQIYTVDSIVLIWTIELLAGMIANYRLHYYVKIQIYIAPLLSIQKNYEPNFICQFEMRIGGNGDGPKWVGFVTS